MCDLEFDNQSRSPGEYHFVGAQPTQGFIWLSWLFNGNDRKRGSRGAQPFHVDSITEQQCQQILECVDLDRLNAWVRKAVTLTDVNELFEQ